MEQKTYTFVKNVKGSLVIRLESYNMQLPTRSFFIPHNAKSVIIPFAYALGLFISDDAMDQMRLGCFSIQDYESLKKNAIEIGFLPDENLDKDTCSLEDIEKAVLNNDMDFVRDLLDRNNKVEVDSLMVIVNEKLDSVSNGMIKLIENACGVELEIE